MMGDLVITIRAKPGGGFLCSDNRTTEIGIEQSMHGALLEWIAEAVKAGAFEDDSTPLLRPLRLVWPTDYRVFTQKFGARPEYYSRFGLAGHEGVDIRAPTGSNVYACADGIVTMSGWHPTVQNHAYGVQIRIRHDMADGSFETMYAHLLEGALKVKVGDTIKAGQLIALADNTGNSSASHLHLSLRQVGLKNGYKGMIDPEPFFIDGPGR